MCRQVIINLKKLINGYLLKQGITKREILHESVFKKYKRITALTNKTKKSICWYEENGKQITSEKVVIQSKDDQPAIKQVYSQSKKDLSNQVKNDKIQRSLMLLDYCQKNGFEHITRDDLEKFRKREVKGNSKDNSEKNLLELLNFFVNIYEEGFIETNPFIYLKMKNVDSKSRKDFITKENIEKLMDLSTVNLNDIYEVTYRTASLFLYDTAVRAGTARLIQVSDIDKEDGLVKITLRKEVLKGDKETTVMYLYFDQTKKMLDYYLTKVRSKFNPKCDDLFISKHGYGLSRSRFYCLIKNYCKKLNIKTYHDKAPTPHSFRHSFATLNVNPLPFGLRLPIEAICERLCHVGLETAKKHYIHQNPYINKLKHIEYQKQSQKGNALDHFSFDEIRGWLSKIGVLEETIDIVAKSHNNYFVDKSEEDVVIYIVEKEARGKITHLRIPIFSLRKYCLSRNLCKKEETVVNKKHNHRYNQKFIDDLAENWTTKERVMKKLKLHRATFYREAKIQGWQSITVGKIVLVNKKSLIQEV